jgi:hypothetical protein
MHWNVLRAGNLISHDIFNIIKLVTVSKNLNLKVRRKRIQLTKQSKLRIIQILNHMKNSI